MYVLTDSSRKHSSLSVTTPSALFVFCSPVEHAPQTDVREEEAWEPHVLLRAENPLLGGWWFPLPGGKGSRLQALASGLRAGLCTRGAGLGSLPHGVTWGTVPAQPPSWPGVFVAAGAFFPPGGAGGSESRAGKLRAASQGRGPSSTHGLPPLPEETHRGLEQD